MIWENQCCKEGLLVCFASMLARRSLLTERIIFLLSIVWLEAVNVTQPCTGLREMSGVKPAKFYSKDCCSYQKPCNLHELKGRNGEGSFILSFIYGCYLFIFKALFHF